MGDAARGVARTDRIYPFNPSLQVKGVEAVDPGGWGDYEAILSQDIEWAGQWFVRRSAGAHAQDAAAFEEWDVLGSLLLDLDRAFFRLKAAEERFRVSQEGAQLAADLRVAVQNQLREGQVSALEMNLANIEAGRAEAGALAARNELQRAQQDLRGLLGLEAETTIETRNAESVEAPFDASDPEALVQRALAQRPDILAAESREREAQAREKLASLEAVPNLELGAVARRTTTDADPTYGLRISLPLPLWNRGQGERERSEALMDVAHFERRDLELRTRGEVLTALEAFRTATEELEVFRTSVLLPAQENRGLLQRAFQAGRWDLPTTLLLQTQLVDSELAYWESWLRQKEALAEAEWAIGLLPEVRTGGG
jgi:cobalt-zinc-cadmium efflux system outer membrane protein